MRMLVALLALQADDESIRWSRSLDAALDEARDAGKPVFAYLRDDEP
jgi:hypothetical protein